MDIQPLNPDELPKQSSYFNPPGHNTTSSSENKTESELAQAASAADLIRQKLNRIYANEPDPVEEVQEVRSLTEPQRSKHQQFMFELSNSGKSFAEIQTEWHDYYSRLDDDEKQEVWDEFYSANAELKPAQAEAKKQRTHEQREEPAGLRVHNLPPEEAATIQPPQMRQTPRNIEEAKASIIQTVSKRSKRKMTRKQHAQSLLFGLSMGAIAVFVMLFGLFNERIIAPFMTPSKSISDMSIIIDPTNSAVTDTAQIIIPKINVQIPVVYDIPTIQEADVQAGLERGVVHYPTTPNPGEKGNAVIFGHSANNILNQGAYKFAFVLLHKLEIDDVFYVDYGGIRYAYQIYDRKIVAPTEVSVLNTQAEPSTMTLITCDPPGTVRNRLIVVGKQISPDPIANSTSNVRQNSNEKPAELPSDPPSLWGRLWEWL